MCLGHEKTHKRSKTGTLLKPKKSNTNLTSIENKISIITNKQNPICQFGTIFNPYDLAEVTRILSLLVPSCLRVVQSVCLAMAVDLDEDQVAEP